jgi:hypothetical protein
MRSPLRSLPPIQLFEIVGVSSGVTILTVLAVLADRMRGIHLTSPLRMSSLLVFLLYLGSFFLCRHAESVLQQGVEASRWSSEQLDRLRGIVTHPVITALRGAFLLLALYGPIYLLWRDSSLTEASLLFSLIFLLGTVQRIKMLLQSQSNPIQQPVSHLGH